MVLVAVSTICELALIICHIITCAACVLCGVTCLLFACVVFADVNFVRVIVRVSEPIMAVLPDVLAEPNLPNHRALHFGTIVTTVVHCRRCSGRRCCCRCR